jgi:hypothetical protein
MPGASGLTVPTCDRLHPTRDRHIREHPDFQFDNQVPFTSVEVQDTAFGDPDDSWRGLMRCRHHAFCRPSRRWFEAVGVTREAAYIFNGKLMDTEFLAGMKN